MQISVDERTKYHVLAPDYESLKETIYSCYYQKKERLKQLYHFDGDSDECLIDVHKIAACFAAVLTEYKVFTYSIEEGLPDNILLLNARLAYDVSLDIITMNLLYYYITKGQKDNVDKLLQNGLCVPMTTKGHDEYNLGRIKTILLNDIFGNEFDVLTYSDMMFWIEYYNRQILENSLRPEPMGDKEYLQG